MYAGTIIGIMNIKYIINKTAVKGVFAKIDLRALCANLP